MNADSRNSLDVVFGRLPLSFICLSAVFFIPSPFVDVLFVYAFECAVISSLLLFLFIRLFLLTFYNTFAATLH